LKGGNMKFFIDTANVDEIKEAASLGILDGVTTNPTLLSREIKRTNRPYKAILKEICEIVKGPVSAEVINLGREGIIKDARKLAKIHKNIVIKVPLTKDGLKATKLLETEGIRVNTTLVFSSNQALLAAKAGSSYVSPFIGRLDDAGQIGMELVREMVQIYENYDIATEIIVASIRLPLHVIDAALTGADIATIPFKVIELMIKHPLTDVGVKRFLDDWAKIGSLTKL